METTTQFFFFFSSGVSNDMKYAFRAMSTDLLNQNREVESSWRLEEEEIA